MFSWFKLNRFIFTEVLTSAEYALSVYTTISMVCVGSATEKYCRVGSTQCDSIWRNFADFGMMLEKFGHFLSVYYPIVWKKFELTLANFLSYRVNLQAAEIF